MRIIVVEDTADLREQVVTFLSLSGFDVVGVGSAAELYRRMAVETFSVVVLDLRLPDEDGLSIAAHVRRQPNIGIIMVTSRATTADRVRGFDAGADIYLPKPVEMSELVAAVRSLGRRLHPAQAAAGLVAGEKGDGACWRFDRAGFALVAPGGHAARLTAKEVALVDRLTAHPGTVASRGALLAALGYDPEDPGNRNLDAALRRLRLKVEEQTTEALPLRTVHSVGYAFDGEVVRVTPSPP